MTDHRGIPEERFMEMLKLNVNPARFLNTTENRSFILPLSREMYTKFEDLVELAPEDTVYHGTTDEKLTAMKKTGIIYAGENRAERLSVTTIRELAVGYAKRRGYQTGRKGILLGIRVEDIPSGVLPPDCIGKSKDGSTFLYYGHVDGEGAVVKAIPFKNYMAEAV